MACRTHDDIDLRYRQQNLTLEGLTAERYSAPALRLVTYDPAEQTLPELRPVRRAQSTVRRRKNTLARQRNRAMERFVLAGTTIAALGLIAIGSVQHYLVAQPAHMVATSIVVAPGDTLWSVAGRYAKSGVSTADEVTAIRSANASLSESQPLHVGEHIVVP